MHPYPKVTIASGIIIMFTMAILLARPITEALSDQPASFSLSIPFTPQAPLGNWDGNKDCEEASATMVDSYFKGSTESVMDIYQARNSMDALIAWEQAKLGHHEDTNIGDIGRMVEAVLGLETKQIKDFNEKDLKRELLRNRPLILPLDITLLGEAQYDTEFSRKRPYHVIVIRGYDEKGFFVNDPGMSAGINNFYSFETLQKATSDWDSTTKKLTDQKVALAVWK